MLNMSEVGIWEVLDEEYRTILDQHIKAELSSGHKPYSFSEFMRELANELTDEVALCRSEAIEQHIRDGVVLVSETLPPAQWHTLRGMMDEILRGFYALRKLDIVARQYVEARDKEVENESE